MTDHDRTLCIRCDRPREIGMFCRWHNCLELGLSMIATHWTTREDLASLYEKMATRDVEQLRDFAREHGAALLYQLATRILETAGPRYRGTIYVELKRWVAGRRDKLPAKRVDANAFVPPPTLEPTGSAADLGLEEPAYTLGLES